MEKYCIHCYVSGKVQGVFFRSSAQQRAQQLGLTGYTRNLSDGRVEVCACGEPQSVITFQNWLRQGPIHAKVTSVQCETHPFTLQHGFRIVY